MLFTHCLNDVVMNSKESSFRRMRLSIQEMIIRQQVEARFNNLFG